MRATAVKKPKNAPLPRRYRIDLAPMDAPLSGSITVVAPAKREALRRMRTMLEERSSTITKNGESGAIMEVTPDGSALKLRDVYEVSRGPSLLPFLDATEGVEVLEESALIDVCGKWIRVERAGKCGWVSSNLREDEDEDQDEDAQHDDGDAAADDYASYYTAVDALESMVLAQFCAGVDVTTPQYKAALETCFNAIRQNLT